MKPYIIAVFSVKGGVGKTTTSVLLAYYLSLRANKNKIVLVDNDFTGAGATTWFLNQTRDKEGNYTDESFELLKSLSLHNNFTLVKGQSNLDQAMLSHSYSKIKLIGAMKADQITKNILKKKPKAQIQNRDWSPNVHFNDDLNASNIQKKILKKIECDFMIIDCKGDMDLTVDWALNQADMVISPLKAESLFGIKSIETTHFHINRVSPSLKTIRFIPSCMNLTRTSAQNGLTGMKVHFNDFLFPDFNEKPFFISDEDDILEFVNQGKTLKPSSKSYKEIQHLVKGVIQIKSKKGRTK